MKKSLLFTLLLALSALAFGQKLPFQGKLIEAGTPVEGTRSFVFEIASVGWSETHSNISVTDGLYFVVLGSINPLPDSLFYGVSEQSMAISVDGTVLSPVTLFKPLSSPFEGSELVVKNDEGTKVGEIKALSLGQNKNGEVNVYGTNGSKNISLGAISHWQTPGNDFGWMYLSNDESAAKVTLGVTPYRGLHGSGELTLRGEENSSIYQGFNSFDNLWEYPTIGMYSPSGNRVNIGVVKSDTVELGQMSLTSNTNEEMYASPTGIFAKNNGTQLAEFTTQSWGGQGQSGLIRVNAPNGNPNIEFTSQSWINPNFPWVRLAGENLPDALQMFLDNDGTEAANLKLFSIGRGSSSLTTDSWNMSGPNSSNIQLGARSWEGTPDLPLINLFGENDFHALELSITRDGENNQFGWINLNSENGKNLYLSPEGLGVQGVSMSTTVNQNGNFGSFTLHGPNSDNFQFMPSWWDQPDLGRMLVLGTSQMAAIDMGAFPENGFEVGTISISSTDGSSANWNPKRFEMHNGFRTASLESTTNNDGTFGSLILDGPNSRNITLMPEWWDKPDMAKMVLSGTSNGAVDLEVADEGNGQFGLIHLYSDYQKSIRMEPTYIALRDDDNGYNPLVFISTNNDNGSWAGSINVNGPNSSNVFIGAQQNTDLPAILLQGTDGFEAMQIAAVDDATQRGFIKMVNKQSGEEMFYSSDGVGGNTTFNIGNDVLVNGTVTETSDRRFKKNIQTLEGSSLQKVNLIQGVSYNWRQDEFPEKNFSSDKQIGVIAQELEAQFPALVRTDKFGYKSVNYNGFTAVLLEAVKELNAKVEKLETENSQLKAELSVSAFNKTEIDQLKAQMENLVKLVQDKAEAQTADNYTSTPGLK